MLRFTHIYELLYKVVFMIIILLVSGLISSIVVDLIGNKQANFTIEVVVFIISMLGIAYWINTTLFWIPSYLYIRFTLFTKVSPSEAKELSFLFDGSL
jgi:hypothetical protein